MVSIKDFGHIDSIFLAHSSNDVIRFQASSGGFIKSFLVYLLESLTVDFVVITRTGGPSNPLLPETIITNSKEDILSTRANSVYAVNNPFPALKELAYDKRYAFVGLPCHVRNLRALQKKGKHRNIVIAIGLFCNHTPNIEFTRGILQKLNVKEHDVQQIEYRGSGWPGGFTAYLENGQKKFIALKDYWSNDLNNGPQKCKSCSEIGTDADIVVGDPWNLELAKTDKKGTSLVICRNPETSKLIMRSSELGYIEISNCSKKDLLQSQGYHIEGKIKRGALRTSNTRDNKFLYYICRAIYYIAHPAEGFPVGSNIVRAILKKPRRSINRYLVKLKAVLNECKHSITLLKEPDRYTLTYIACNTPILKYFLKGIFKNRVLIWYWREKRKLINLGDYITHVLLNRFGYKTVNYSNASSLNLLSTLSFCLLIIGSELHRHNMDRLIVPELYIWGQGKGHGDFFDIKSKPYVNKVRIFAVRGPHTVKQLNLYHGTPLGDPAFLMPLFFNIQKDPSQNQITYIPHHTNRERRSEKIKEIGAERYIDIMCTRRKFWSKLIEIVSSKFVLTNSFHTAVICHAYGTPWALCLADGDELNFPDKWRDFFEFLGINKESNVVTNYREGLRWWENIGSKLKTPDLWPLLDSFPLPIKDKEALNVIEPMANRPDTSKFTCAFIIRFHYEKTDPRFERRLKHFEREVLPRIQSQTDQGFDVCIRCNPIHDEIFRNLGCKPFHVKNEYADYVLSEDGKEKFFYDFVKWEDCIDLEQYDVQMGLDSDDIIAPNYVEKIKLECAKSKTSLHIHFQPEEFVLKTRKTRRHCERYGQDGSMFHALYYPDKSEYHHCYETSHRLLPKLASRSILIPSGYCWLTIHDQNESTGRKFKVEELKGVKSWVERPWAEE